MFRVLAMQENRDGGWSSSGEGEGEGEGEGGDAWKVFQSQGQARKGPRTQDPFATYEARRGGRGEGPAPPMKSLAKLSVKGGKGLKEASVTDATTQAQAPLIPERRTKLTAEGRQAVPRPGVGDEAEAGAKNNQGVGKQKGTTSEAVRSPKPHVQSIAKNKVGVEQQKEIAEPSKVPPPIERNKAEKKQGSENPTEIAMSLEVVGSQIIHENSAGEKKQNVVGRGSCCRAAKAQAKKTKGKGSLVKPTEKPYVELYIDGLIDGKLVRMCRANPACPSRNTKMEKRTRMMDHLKKQHGLNVAIPTTVGGRVGGVSLNLVPKSSIRDQIRTQERFQEVDRKYEVNRKAVERRAVIRALECWDCINKKHVRCSKDDFVTNFVASRMRKADAMQELKKDAIIRKIRQGYEHHEDREEAEDEGGEEKSGEEEEKSICQEGEEEEDEGGDEEGGYDEEEGGEKEEEEEGGDEEGGYDEEEGGEKEEEEGIESDEENEDGSDGEKTDEGEGSIGDDEDSKDDGKGSADDGKGIGDDGKGGSGDDGKGDEEGDHTESMDGSDEGDAVGASMDGSGSDERDDVGWTVENEESTPEPSGGGGTPGAAIALASMKGRFSLGLSFISMEVIRFLEGNMY
ncbi:hypothetical protein L7F22_067749 [Adiantum nelumboides]|nr:hypothetical protein [Adiantum nelumboides]